MVLIDWFNPSVQTMFVILDTRFEKPCPETVCFHFVPVPYSSVHINTPVPSVCWCDHLIYWIHIACFFLFRKYEHQEKGVYMLYEHKDQNRQMQVKWTIYQSLRMSHLFSTGVSLYCFSFYWRNIVIINFILHHHFEYIRKTNVFKITMSVIRKMT